jgi:GntR family transcriptional regulator, transcriptional repressor for pyruvate dehydrogenase complex
VRGSTSTAPAGGATSRSSDRNLHAFRPITLQKAADAVVAVIADAIRGGLFEPGDLLPSERALATQLQVSRNVVREGIDTLRREGIVSVKRGVGGGIRIVAVDRLQEVVAGLHGKTHDLMRAALEARRAIEPPAFLLAAERATASEIGALQKLVDGLERLGADPQAFYTLDQRFHREVVRLSGNPLLIDFYGVTLLRLAEIRQEFPVLQVLFKEAVDNQRTLYAALKSRAPAAIDAALDAHLVATEVVYLGQPLKPSRPSSTHSPAAPRAEHGTG